MLHNFNFTMPVYKSKFTATLKVEFPFLKSVNSEECEVMCYVCNSTFSVANGGRSSILQHVQSSRHQKAKSSSVSSKKIDGFFPNLNNAPTGKELQTAAKELVFSYHTAKHGLSLRVAECTAKLVNTMFESSFTAAKTKTSCLVQKVLMSISFKICP